MNHGYGLVIKKDVSGVSHAWYLGEDGRRSSQKAIKTNICFSKIDGPQ